MHDLRTAITPLLHKGDRHFHVSVIMINSRGNSHPEYVQRARESVWRQNLQVASIDLVEVYNQDKKHTIGTCWNHAVNMAKPGFITFLGDDDQIAPEFCDFMMDFYLACSAQWPVAGVSCYCKPCDRNQNPIPGAYLEGAYTGFFPKAFLQRNPFNEILRRGVDQEHLKRISAEGHAVSVCPHYFGYYYTMHPGQVSGMKTPAKKKYPKRGKGR